DDPAVLEEGARYLRIVGFNYVPMALMFTLTGVMRGAGDTMPSLLISFLSLWVVRLPLAWWLTYGLGMGAAGVWWSIVIRTTLALLLNYWYYQTGNWKRRVAIGPRPAEA